MKTVLLALGKHIPSTKLMHFYKHNLSLKDVWTTMQASFEPIEGVTIGSAIPDLTVWVPGTLVLSDHAAEAMLGIADTGELLPVDTSLGRYWILNCMRELVADGKRSAHLTESGQVLDVESLHFNEEDAERAELFKSPFDGYRNLFCSARWKDSVSNAGLVGIDFSNNLANSFA